MGHAKAANAATGSVEPPIPPAVVAVEREDRELHDLGQIYRAHGEAVARWARRLLGPGGEVDDVVHEVFLVAQRRLADFRGDARITTWLYAITVRVVQDRRRKERWRRWLPGAGRTGGHRALAELPAQGPGPHEQVESRRAAELVYRILDRLAEKDRSLLILFEIEGLTGEEIAAVTGCSLANVWVKLHRARGRFLKAYETWERRAAPIEEDG
jgi:RNA polymerase sigma-70 factor (ECF subfamily)